MEKQINIFNDIEVTTEAMSSKDMQGVKETYTLPGVFSVCFDFIEDVVFVHPTLYAVGKGKLRVFKRLVQHICKYIGARDGVEFLFAYTDNEKFVKVLSNNKYTKHSVPALGDVYAVDVEDL
jgi:hypothetical protein